MAVSLLVFVLLVTLSMSHARDLTGYHFGKYLSEFGKTYSDASEYSVRKSIFEANLAKIRAHNANPHNSWTMGVNHLTDITDEEYNNMMGYKWTPYTPKYEIPYVPSKVSASPVFVDWRQKGVVTDVKDQGRCGSCWSFGTAEVIESHFAIATGQLPVLSEQQILDCVPNPNDCGGTGGCGGGIPEIAYDTIVEMGGLASEWTYPYISYFGANETCRFTNTTTKPVAVLKGYMKLPSNQYQPVIDTLADVGPLAINVDATAWRSYSSGVFTGCNTTNSDINHVVLLVGYGTDPKLGDYWIIRNSWTPAWGEAGYIRIARSSTAPCTPDTNPGDGTGCNGGPSVVTVCGACGILYDTSYPVLV